MSLNFNDKVVVITGAGGGLGKHYALEYAKRGAKVVVNDLGGSLVGSGGSSKAADLVVEEIRKNGGTAVANYDSVEFGDKIIKTAVDNFGTVHVIVNNAGILRDSSFKNMTDKDWKLVLDVHLNGAYKLTRAAWPYLKNQNYGRIISTCSPAGLYGNFGQANYSAAKSALIGFGETLAKEGAKYNIYSNVIAPLARSRMTEEILPKDILENLGAEKIAPLVLYLSHESSKANNSIFEVAAGFYGQIRWERSSGELFKTDESFTPEAILNKYEGIFKFEDKPFNKVTHPTQIADYGKLVEFGKTLPPNDQGSKKVSLKGKVVIVTGAGAGLGRAHALLFGKYGAKVVVNDFKDSESVVNEIKAAGGEAVGNNSNVVTGAEEIVKTALDTYGRVDVLVNNAGILRDRSFLKLSDKEWFDVIDVHVNAIYKLSKAVWPHFLKQKSGNIINTSSTSGIYGNFGQANYGAAKAAVLGFTKTLAIEGAKAGIRVNVIAPHAETAMTKTIFREEDFNKYDPSLVSPFIVLLASDAVKTTGETFEVGGGWVGNTRWQRAKGAVSPDGKATPEFIQEHWSDVVDFSAPKTVASTRDSLLAILDSLNPDQGDDEDEDDEDDEEEESEKKDIFTYTERDVILYNLGLGASASELNYVYENNPKFEVLPSFGVIPFMSDQGALDFNKLLKNFNPALLLHGEQYLKIAKFPIPTSAVVKTESYPVSIQNKGDKAAVVVGGFKTTDTKTGELLFYNESTTFVRKAQAAGGPKNYHPRTSFATASHNAPNSSPDFEVEVATFPNQAAIYRLSGDYNPLHLDPAFAKQANFNAPILHGLATFGISLKQLYEKYGPISEVKVRFTNVVYPGEKLKIKAWKKGDTVIFQTWSVDRNVAVISNAAFKLLKSDAKL
jgi:multifunctional beta-oxidation protein